MAVPLKVTAVQMASGPHVPANLLEVERLVAEAAHAGTRLVVLPENFAFMGRTCSEVRNVSETDGAGPLQDFLSQLARRHDLWLVGGTVPLMGDNPERVRAACLVFDHKGQRVARYDKIHLFDVTLVATDEHYAESNTFEAGDPGQTRVIDSPVGRLGIAVCYDLRFPELFRQLLDQGCEVIALPSAFTAVTGKAHWEPLVRARAIENLSYVIAAAQGGYHISGRETYGHSMIVDPWGSILAEVARGSAAITAEVNIDFLRATRRHFPSIEHRRIGRG